MSTSKKVEVGYNEMLNPDGTPKFTINNNGTIQGAGGNFGIQPPTYSEGMQTVNTPSTFNGSATTPQTVSPTGSTVVTNPYGNAAVGTPYGQSTPSYSDYAADNTPSDVGDLYTDDIKQTDADNKVIIDEINASGTSTNPTTPNTTSESINKQLESDLSYADQVLADTLGLNDQQYQKLIDSINTAYTTGLALAEETRKLLLNVSEGVRNQIYKAAEAARKREEEQAEIERQRGIYDASNAYEQNKSTYGANAEALAAMGLTGGGYSDYLNAQAYATQRGEVQAANANAEAAKRAARYAEDEKKNAADISYAEAAANAAIKYSEDVNKVTTTYQEKMSEADLWKLEADAGAKDTHRDTIKAAEDSAAKATQTYKDGMFEYLLGEINNGNYSPDALQSIIDKIGFSEEQINILNNAAGKVSERTEADKKDSQYQNYQKISAALKEDPDSYSDADIDRAVSEGAISAEDGELLKNEKSTNKTIFDSEELKDNIYSYIEAGDIAGATANADKLKAEGKIDDPTYKQVYYDSWKAALDAQSLTADNIESVLREIRVDAESKKLSAEKAKELSKYAWSKLGRTYTSSAYGLTIEEDTGLSVKVKIGDKTYKFTKTAKTPGWSGVISTLNAICTGDKKETPAKGTVVEFDGNTYVYLGADDKFTGWVKQLKEEN